MYYFLGGNGTKSTEATVQWDRVSQRLIKQCCTTGNTGHLKNITDWAHGGLGTDNPVSPGGKKIHVLRNWNLSSFKALDSALSVLSKSAPEQGHRSRLPLSFHQALWEGLGLGQLSASFSSKKEKKKTILKCIWNHKSPQITQTALNKRNSTQGIMIPDLKLYFRVFVVKNNMVLAQNQTCRPMDPHWRLKQEGPQSFNIWGSCQKLKLEKRKHLQQMC